MEKVLPAAGNVLGAHTRGYGYTASNHIICCLSISFARETYSLQSRYCAPRQCVTGEFGIFIALMSPLEIQLNEEFLSHLCKGMLMFYFPEEHTKVAPVERRFLTGAFVSGYSTEVAQCQLNGTL